MTARLAIDIGRTFTELALLDEGSGNVYTTKILSTTKDPTSGVFSALPDFLSANNISPTEITTVVTSTSLPLLDVADKNHTKVALLTTCGFEHTLLLGGVASEFGTSNPHLAVQATPPADLTITRGVPERVTAGGEIAQPLDTGSASALIQEVLDLGAEHIAISLLHSYANPMHERMLRDLVQKLNPRIPVTISTDLRRVFHEYERATLTVLNAYLHTSMKDQLESLDTKLKAMTVSSDIFVGRSDGGTMTAARAKRSPIFSSLSAGAFAAAAARRLTSSLGLDDSLALNWTGNTAEITLIQGQKIRCVRNGSVGLYRPGLPTLGTKTIGPGTDGHIRVSAAGNITFDSDPGTLSSPACYGLGSSTATLTDAMHLLGRLPCGLLGGRIALDTAAAGNAMGPVAKALQMELVEAADTVVSVANEKVFGALCQLAAANGIDPERLTLIACGGAGPLQANALGVLGGLFKVVVPANAGTIAAKEALSALPLHELSQTILKPLNDLTVDDFDRVLQKLHKHVKAELEDEKSEEMKCNFVQEADLRYCGDGLEVMVTLTLEDSPPGPEWLATQFPVAHRAQMGYEKDQSIELVNLRVIGYVNRHADMPKPVNQWTQRNKAVPNRCRVYFDGDFIETEIHDRSSIVPERPIQGPAVIVEHDTTTLVYPDHQATLYPDGSLLIQHESTVDT